MPPLLSVEIPVIVRSDQKGKAPLRRAPKPRIYSDEPLPVGPSSHAPKNAKITGRVIDISGGHYTLKIGEVELNDVSVEEILEYVSPLELEEYENHQFVEEGIAQEAAEAAEEAARQERLERMKHRAKTKGIVAYQSDTETNDETEAGEAAVGRHGRARPTYTHLFKRFKEKKGKLLVPAMDRSLDMNGDDDEEVSEDEPANRAPIVRGPISFTELPKRRRRKRDKITGELLPLSPVTQKSETEQQKRKRRRRHPLTGELMPVGWRFDPNEESDTYEQRRAGQSPLNRQMSVSQEHEAKRPRLDNRSEVTQSSSPLPPQIIAPTHVSPSKLRPFVPGGQFPANALSMDLVSSEDEAETAAKHKTISAKSPPKSLLPHSTNRMMESMALSSAAETSPEPVLKPFISTHSPAKSKLTGSQAGNKVTSPSRPKVPKTSITSPTAGRASSTEPPMQASEEEESDEEWFIENILAHSLSDPKTHPAALGHKPLMLYQVKWEGFKEPSWEPAESFTDKSILNEYRRQHGLTVDTSDDEMDDEEDGDATLVAPTTITTAAAQSDESADNEDDMDEDEYEVEGIVGHQLSDPRAHPADLGRKPVMLYHVKWKGYDELTWEPASSFEDIVMIQSYNDHFGLEDVVAQSGEKMDESA